jgi:uncharacterized RmlC-like cupin family protein
MGGGDSVTPPLTHSASRAHFHIQRTHSCCVVQALTGRVYAMMGDHLAATASSKPSAAADGVEDDEDDESTDKSEL